MGSDPLNLQRFREAQEDMYATALAELQRGRKQSHWIWYILPQLQGLGSSAMAERYGIADLAEARAYLADPLLGPRLLECIAAILSHRGTSAQAILGEIDALKFRSCLTLFAQAAPSVALFAEALQHFFAGQPDPRTLSLLAQK